MNLALAFRLGGECSGRGLSLKKASRLCHLVLQLLKVTQSHDAEVAVVAVLAYNNKAQIHYEHSEYDRFGKCLESVSDLPQNTLSFHHGHDNLSEAEVEGLMLNTTLICKPSCSPAA